MSAEFLLHLAQGIDARVPREEQTLQAYYRVLMDALNDHLGPYSPEKLEACIQSLVDFTKAVGKTLPEHRALLRLSLDTYIGSEKFGQLFASLANPFDKALYTKYDAFPRFDGIIKDAKKMQAEEKQYGPVIHYYRALHQTPYLPSFQEILRTLSSRIVPFDFAPDIRKQHQLIAAHSGHGKTQLLEAEILMDLRKEDPPPIFVIDSKGSMVERIAKLDVFHPDHGRLRERLLYIHPQDTPALGPFDVALPDDATVVNAVLMQMSAFFTSLIGSDLTSNMSALINPLIKMLLHYPGANIYTFIDAIDNVEDEQFADAISKVGANTRRFLTHEFKEVFKGATKNAVKVRIQDFLERSPQFEAMFSARRNMVDLAAALREGKIVLINTGKQWLPGELSAIFGRYWIGRIMGAAISRGPNSGRQASLYVDEAKDYSDHNTAEIFQTMREYRLGATYAFQEFDQVPTHLRSAIMANTTLKMVGGGYRADAEIFAKEMGNIDPDVIFAQQRDPGEYPKRTRFMCYIRNVSTSAFIVEVPIGSLDIEPSMDTTAYARMRAKQKAALRDPYHAPKDESVEEEIELKAEPQKRQQWRKKP